MSPESSDGIDADGPRTAFAQMDTVEYLLFDSLVHHMIEKGLLTKNDALSVVQAVAQIIRGYTLDEHTASRAEAALSQLQRTYSSLEAIPHRGRTHSDASNLTHLRPPLHRDRPVFPGED
jgi:polyhydroxyalkanoate synthesis regulator phasin